MIFTKLHVNIQQYMLHIQVLGLRIFQVLGEFSAGRYLNINRGAIKPKGLLSVAVVLFHDDNIAISALPKRRHF